MNLGDLLKQAKDVQAKAGEMQKQLAALEVEGVSGAGLVRVVLNGKSELLKLTVDPSLFKPEDKGIVEDLVVAAHGDAKGKLERRVQDEMQRLAQEMGLPPGLGFGI
ncbi:MAG: YbaB/EbfC family nucleoid-associated protein [Proteobacteria bacterium]|nr:YbaB/EbfC family nucleoid-associated protein [Pseudomonadota bacterium]